MSPDIIGMCIACRRGYVSFVAGAKCHACAGEIVAIPRRPNYPPWADGPFVTQAEPPQENVPDRLTALCLAAAMAAAGDL